MLLLLLLINRAYPAAPSQQRSLFAGLCVSVALPCGCAPLGCPPRPAGMQPQEKQGAEHRIGCSGAAATATITAAIAV